MDFEISRARDRKVRLSVFNWRVLHIPSLTAETYDRMLSYRLLDPDSIRECRACFEWICNIHTVKSLVRSVDV